MKTVAVIPVKSISERVESKNFKHFFNNLSLFNLLINQLKESCSFDEIYVSSDEVNIANSAKDMGFKFIERDKSFCNNITPWSDVIHNVIKSIPEDDDTIIAWCHTTSPLFNRYHEAIKNFKKEFRKNGIDGLVAVKPLKEFIISEKKQPVNYSWGPWHKYSQDLEKYYSITGALFVAEKKQMLRNRYVVSSNPYLFEVSDYEAIDIDNEYDFKLAQLLISNKHLF